MCAYREDRKPSILTLVAVRQTCSWVTLENCDSPIQVSMENSKEDWINWRYWGKASQRRGPMSKVLELRRILLEESMCKDRVIKWQLREHGPVWLELRVGWSNMREYWKVYSFFIKYISSIHGMPGIS